MACFAGGAGDGGVEECLVKFFGDLFGFQGATAVGEFAFESFFNLVSELADGLFFLYAKIFDPFENFG